MTYLLCSTLKWFDFFLEHKELENESSPCVYVRKNAALMDKSILFFGELHLVLRRSVHSSVSWMLCSTMACGKCQSCAAPLTPTHQCLMILSIVIGHYSCKSVKGPLTGLSSLFSFLLSQGEVCLSYILFGFFWEKSRSQRDQFLVILVVTLLFIVVFNNSTIYGQNNELKCVIVLAVALEAGGHSVTEFLSISHSLSSSRTYFIGSKVAKWHWPNIIWFP